MGPVQRSPGSSRWTAFIMLGLCVAMVAGSTPVAACSLASQAFNEAAWVGPDRFVATLEHRVVMFDLVWGEPHDFAGGVFHELAANPQDGVVAVRVQEGLGGDCSGERYLDFRDADTGERLHRFAGSNTPLAASDVGVVAGQDQWTTIRFYPWTEPSDWHEVETGLPQTYEAWGTPGALRGPGDLLAVASSEEAELRFVDVDQGGQWPGLGPIALATQALDRNPGMAFEPAGTKLALLFSSGGRDRLMTFDVVEGEREMVGLLNVSSWGEAERWTPPGLAWTSEGIATIHGDAIRHVDRDGNVNVATLRAGDVAQNVVADPQGGSWVVLVSNWDDGHRVMRFTGDGEPVAQWRQERDGYQSQWVPVPEGNWTRFAADENKADPSWSPPASTGGDVQVDPEGTAGAGDSAASPGPGVFALLLIVAIVVARWNRSAR